MYGKKLKKLLEERGIKQIKLAEMINVPPTTINGWMDKYYLRLENIEKICNALNMKIYDFFIDEPLQMYNLPEPYSKIINEIEKLPKEKKEIIIDLINLVLKL